MKQDKENKTITKKLRMTPTEWDKISAKMNELGDITFSRYAINSMLSRSLSKTLIAKELHQGKSIDRVTLTLSINRLKL